jgi:isopenicillin N synthase-like dioxygenase
LVGGRDVSRRLASVSLANWRSDDPRARRRFVTAFGDALREQGAVAVEGTASVPGALDQLLQALAAYFGLTRGAFSAHVGPGGSGIEVARLSRSGAEGRIAVNDHVARGEVAVFTAGPALEVWTGGVVRAHAPEVLGEPSVESAWTAVVLELLPEFRAEPAQTP